MWRRPAAPETDKGMWFRHGPIVLRYEPPTDRYATWCNLSMSFGRHFDGTTEECLQDWPTLAISEARAALDNLERYLKEQNSDSVDS
jgi:hypothetical protein